MSFGGFRKARTGPILSHDESVRQGRAVRSAQAALGSVEEVRAFLNSHDETLSGRPIDLAVASEKPPLKTPRRRKTRCCPSSNRP